MRIILPILLFISVVSNAQRSDRWEPNKTIRGTLESWEYEKGGRAKLMVKTGSGDTLTLSYGWYGIGRRRFVKGMNVTVEYDSKACNNCSPGTWVKSRIRIN